MSILAVGAPFGMIGGFLIGGAVSELYGWRAALLAVGLPGLLLAMVMFLRLREPERLEFMGRLAALVPKPRVNLTRFHGVFSPNSKPRKHVVPRQPTEKQEPDKPKAYGMSWAQRLKRVFAIEIEKCEKCGGPVRVIASIEDPDVIQKILKHLGLDQASQPQIRSPPEALFDYSANLS
jgi:hypothetical protein